MSKFRPGQSGNPSGRPKGRTLADELRKTVTPRFREVVGVIVDRALDGDMQAASLLLSRLVPPLRPVAEPIQFEAGGNPIAKAEAVIDAMAAGDLTPDEAKATIGAIHEAAKVRETHETNRQIELLHLSILKQGRK